MSEIHGAVGSYVVNALDGAELSEFEAHLAGCDTCQREVLEFSETAAQLGRLVEAPAPATLRSSILAAIREVRPLPPEEQLPAPGDYQGPRRGIRETGAVGREVDASGGTPETKPPATGRHISSTAPAVDELAIRRQRRTTRLLSLAVAAALVIALALGGWVINLVQTRQAQVAEANLETQLLTAPDAKVYNKTMVNGSTVSFVVSKELNKALFVGRDVPPAGPGKKYQLWTFDTSGQPVPNNLFDGGTATKTWFRGDVQSATALAITVEPRTGSTKPTTPALVVAKT